MIVFGGTGKDENGKAYEGIYILNLDTFVWEKCQNIHGDIP